MKKNRQRRIIKKKKPSGQPELLMQFVSGIAFTLGKAIGNVLTDMIEKNDDGQPVDQTLDYCKYCKTYYKDQCNCQDSAR